MEHQIYYTGIKAVDLFAPIPLGGDILISGEAKSGPRVLGSEMAFRLANQPGHGIHVLAFLDLAGEDAEAYEKEFKESVTGNVELVKAASVSADDIRRHLTGYISDSGNAVFGISKNSAFIDAFRRAVKSARGSAAELQNLSSFVITEALFPEGFDARIVLTRLLATEGIYPPIDVLASSSSASAAMKPDQRSTANAVKKTVSDLLANFQPGAFKDPNWSFNRDPAKHPAVQTVRFLSQPYFCAEPYTGLKSAYVPISETVADFQAILAGRYSTAPVQSFYMKNSLPPEMVREFAKAAN